MKEGKLQKMYKILQSRRIRIAALNISRLLGIKNLLVRMDTNNLCDLRCEMCPEVSLRRSRDFKPVIMSLIDFKRIAGQVFPKVHILYMSCAGEPLLTPRFEDYINVAASYRVPFLAFVTNGMKLREEIVDACILNQLNQIAISADGASAATYEAIRTGASFTRLLANLTMIQDMKRQANSRYPEIRLNYTISKSNWKEVVEFIDLAYDYDVSSVQFRPLTPFDNNPWSEMNQLDKKANKRVTALLEKVDEKTKRCGIKLLGHGEFTGMRVQEDGSMIDNCIYPWFYRYIHPDGGIKICPRREAVGDLLEQDYDSIMKSDKVKRIKQEVRTRGEGCVRSCSAGIATTEL